MRIVLRFRAPRGVPGGYVGASLAAHAVFAAALVLVPLLRPRPPLIPVDATVVELAGPLPTPSRGGSSAVAAPAPPKPAPKVVEKPAEKPPAPEKLVLAKPSKKKEPDKKKKPEPAEGAEGPPSAPPAPASPAPAGAGTGVTALEGGGVPGAGWYNAAVTSALQSAWVKPVLDAADQAYSVVVAFEIGRDGNVFNLAVDIPSGVAALDRSALRAVTDAAPFPAPPASAGGSIRQRIRFELTPE
ncbi:MAG TPA: energy transducer TonB [Candidatus Polarisedimenticolaceae bacterium]